MGVPVGSEFFSAAFAGVSVNASRVLLDLTPILIPPFSSAGIAAELFLSAGLGLNQF